jgi:hypothetical protein
LVIVREISKIRRKNERNGMLEEKGYMREKKEKLLKIHQFFDKKKIDLNSLY